METLVLGFLSSLEVRQTHTCAHTNVFVEEKFEGFGIIFYIKGKNFNLGQLFKEF